MLSISGYAIWICFLDREGVEPHQMAIAPSQKLNIAETFPEILKAADIHAL